MKNVFGDLWTYPADWHCVPTNGDTRRDGYAVMGRGCAREAAQYWPAAQKRLGLLLELRGNRVHDLGLWFKHGRYFRLFSFPAKHHWRGIADLQLIERSCEELHAKWATVPNDKPTVVIPRPGCGNGGLLWAEVEPILQRLLTEPEFCKKTKSEGRA
mgnify:CR=1 FL=1